MAPSLHVQGICRAFGSLQVLRGVDWEVPERGIHGLVGPNGAGKTTLYGILCGFLAAHEGQVEIAGRWVTPTTPPALGVVGVLPQDAMMPAHLPIGTTLTHYGRLQGLDRRGARAAAMEALGAVGLKDSFSSKPKTLSHGMFKRVAIAQAFMGTPRLVLLDEPTAGLDPQAAMEVRGLLRELRGDAAIVVSSHNLAEIEDLCDTVAILDGGRIVRHDTVADVIGEAASLNLRLIAPPSEVLAQALGALPFVTHVTYAPEVDRLRVGFDASRTAPVAAARDVIAVLADQRVDLLELQIGASLEQRFLEETGAP